MTSMVPSPSSALLLVPALAASAFAQSTPSNHDGVAASERWSFRAPRSVELPATRDGAWPANAIDRFVLAKLEQHGLRPAAQASKRTLIRRAYFDLVGLPPPPDAVAAFLADRSPFAWARLVVRLLRSPHFGERWGRHWLDLVRYSESRGHEYDYIQPNAWEYRDYVIRAFNADVPYDRFLVEHIAGDLLPRPRLHPTHGSNESILGTGFWFLGEEVHSPVDPRAEESDRIDNKIDVMTKAFLGLTVGCARCHDHKFDPIPSRDYYALAGFLMSADYRQVRFESLEHNRRIAQRLAQLRRETMPSLAAALAEQTAPRLAGLSEYLDAAHAALVAARTDPTAPRPAGPRPDILFEDFEGSSYGRWSRQGTAFGSAPARNIPAYQGTLHRRGRASVNSHASAPGRSQRQRDSRVGRLQSPPFEIRRDYIVFLVGGGRHPGQTCLDLVIDGKVVRSATGHDSNRMRLAFFDVRDLRGRRARLEIVDTHRGGWGNIGVDHVVFSDRKSEEALSAALPAARARAVHAAVGRIAAARGLVFARLLGFVRRILTAAADPTDPLHPWSVPPPRAVTRRRAPPAPSVVVDYGDAHAPWLADGFAFGTSARRVGELRLTADPAHPVAGVVDQPSAAEDRDWRRLEIDPTSQRDPSQVDWIQPGRTLRTPSVTLRHKRLWYLVRGAGHALVVVDSHRMIDGPLHRTNILSFDGGPNFRWIAHDVSAYTGRRAHVELSPRGSGDHTFAIARIVQAEMEPPLAGAPEVAVPAGSTPAERATAFEKELRQAVFRLARGDTDTRSARRINWLLSNSDLLAPAPASDRLRRLHERYLRGKRDLLEQVRWSSRTAPAMLEGTPVDSPLLVRGNPKTPGPIVPRRFLTALDAAPLSSPATGSGRLELARKIVAPSNPFPARVLVNRVWHHLFGRGIVPTVDNFGALGRKPSHPALLDWLARRFIRHGWSIKRLIRDIVTSKTYRMSSTVTGTRGASIDPENRWLWRAPVRRLQAETVRDAMLAVAGRLDPTLGGPSIPLHPSQYIRGVERGFATGPIDGHGRRSVYLAVRRNCLSQFFLAFDYPLPATTRGRRSVTNVPAQALALLNNPFVLQQAKRWSRNVLRAPAGSDADRIRAMYEAAFARPPTDSELSASLGFLAAQQVDYDGATARAQAWADLCHVLLNVKSFVFID